MVPLMAQTFQKDSGVKGGDVLRKEHRQVQPMYTSAPTQDLMWFGGTGDPHLQADNRT